MVLARHAHSDIMIRICWFAFFFILPQIYLQAQVIDPCSHAIKGRVFDLETKEILPFVTVQLEGTLSGVTTDQNGVFQFDHLCDDEYNLIISHLGYKTLSHHHDAYHEIPDIYLARDELLLESIIIEGKEVADVQSLSGSSLTRKQIDQFKSESFGDLAGHFSGVSMISTGQNITKPVIHGLHSSRILIINDGVRHEFQNWGVDHAPEIDPSQIESLEVVKGAATVRYGPDALGGVLLIHPNELKLNSKINGRAGLTIKSNGRSGNTDFMIGQGYDHFAYSMNGSYTKQGDLRAPGYNLTNTGKNEYSYSAAIRWHKRRFDLESRYSRFYQQLGILRGSVNGNLEDLVLAINSQEPLGTTSFSYNIRQPYQDVEHQLFVLKSSYRLGDHILKGKYSYQINHRQEFDLRRGTNKPTPNIDLELATQSFDLDWLHPDLGKFSGQGGFQWQYQDNNNLPGTRTAQFIPNYNYQRLGLFFIESMDLEPVTFEFGLRYDYHYMASRGVFQNQRYNNELVYNNLTSSIGLIKTFHNESQFRFNFGSAWRPPNMAELYSFGRHQAVYEYGFWTYKLDDSNNAVTSNVILSNDDKPVESELGYKWIASYEFTKDKIRTNLTAFFNRINNYIFTKPAGITNTVRGAFPYFIYDQADAVFWGIDLQMEMNHSDNYQSKFSAAYVWAKNISNNEYFVGTPPINLKYDLGYQGNVNFANKLNIDLSLDYNFKQFQAPRVILVDDILKAQQEGINIFEDDNSIFDILKAPAGYLLLGFSTGLSWDHFQVDVKVNNTLNKSYRSYTDRIRYFSDEVGRNILISINYKL